MGEGEGRAPELCGLCSTQVPRVEKSPSTDLLEMRRKSENKGLRCGFCILYANRSKEEGQDEEIKKSVAADSPLEEMEVGRSGRAFQRRTGHSMWVPEHNRSLPLRHHSATRKWLS